jgi:DNA replication and repair protein RecF
LAGRFPAVLFGPHDLRVVSGEPEHRRRFLDMIGTMTNPAFLRAAVEYRRVIEQRNAALKARASRGEMVAWNERLVESGTDLIMRRHDLAGAIERETESQANDLGSPFNFSMRYESSLLVEGASEDRASIVQRFHSEVDRRTAEEVRRGVTLVGPHRDDLEMKMDGQDVRKFGSQGQRRLLAVLIKLAEMAYLERELREPCVLLLDDVFSEFDEAIIGKLQRLLEGARQVFVTSPVPAAVAAQAHGLRVEAGRIAPA